MGWPTPAITVNFSTNEATDIAVDGAGFVYVTGAAELWGLGTGFEMIFVVKLTPDGLSDSVDSIYLRGSGSTALRRLPLMPRERSMLVGHTTSTDFPLVTPFQSALNGSSGYCGSRSSYALGHAL